MVDGINRRFLREKTKFRSLLLDMPLRNLELFWPGSYKVSSVRKSLGMLDDNDESGGGGGGDNDHQFACYVFTVNIEK